MTETEATEEDELLDLKTNIKEMVAQNDGLVGEVESTRGAGDGHHPEKTKRGHVGRNEDVENPPNHTTYPICFYCPAHRLLPNQLGINVSKPKK